jgi:hypothetical protein
MSTNINFVNSLGSENDTRVDFNLPRTILLKGEGRAIADGGIAEAELCSYNTLNDLSYNGLLRSASLIVTPNGYKEGTLFSVIPSNGNGDFTVTRATTATRVNSAGLVELVPYNLLQYSQAFDNAIWTQANGNGGSAPILTPNYGISPNGTQTAYRIQLTRTSASSSYSYVYQANSVPSGGTYTFSVWLKSLSGTPLISLSYDGTNYTNIVTLTTEWQRYEFTTTALSTNLQSGFLLFQSLPTTSLTADFLAYGYQLVEGTTAKDYQKTETRLNIPRLDYSNGTCPSLLVEPQRTNSCLYSNKISDSTWLKFFDNGGLAPIITDNYAISPDVSQNAQRIQLTRTNTANSYSYILQNITGIVGQSYTWSVWLKSLSGTPSVALSNVGGSYANIVTLSNEWERYEFTATAVGTGLQAMFLIFEAIPSTSLTADFLAYGFQLELGSYPTSYIPTTSASVTRNADVVSKTGISSLIGQTEGTMFLDVDFTEVSDYNGWFMKDVANFDTFAFIQRENTGIIAVGYYGSGALQVRIETAPSQPIGRYKIGFGYKNNDFVLYINGTQIGTDTSGSVSGLMNFLDAHYSSTGSTLQNVIALWKTRLTNTQLQTLTSI